MWRQNDLFRRLATDYWLRLLIEAGKDPAMLIWLDQAQSRKEHPNENYAREVMELFSLGEGHYTEKDVTEARARSPAGRWTGTMQQFIYRPLFHDNGDKTFLGLTGNLNGEDVMAQIVKAAAGGGLHHGQAVEFLCRTNAVRPIERTRLPTRSVENARHFKPFLRVDVPQRGILQRRRHPQPGEKPRAMAGRHRADVAMRPAARAHQRRHAAQPRPGFVRAAECQGLGRRHHLDHDEHFAGTLQRRGDAGARRDPAAFSVRFCTQSPAARAARCRKRPRNASTLAAWTWTRS